MIDVKDVKEMSVYIVTCGDGEGIAAIYDTIEEADAMVTAQIKWDEDNIGESQTYTTQCIAKNTNFIMGDGPIFL